MGLSRTQHSIKDAGTEMAPPALNDTLHRSLLSPAVTTVSSASTSNHEPSDATVNEACSDICEGQDKSDNVLPTFAVDGVDLVPSVSTEMSIEQQIIDSIATTSSQASVMQPSSQDMEQLMNVLEGTSADMDILQVIKNLELLNDEDVLNSFGGNGGALDMDLVPNVPQSYIVESPIKEEQIDQMVVQQKLEEIKNNQFQLERKLEFLIRRLYKQAARATGQHVSEEIAGFLEHVVRYCKKNESPSKSALSSLLTPTLAPPTNLLQSPSTLPDIIPYQPPTSATPQERLKPVSTNEMKSFLRRIDSVSTMQNTMLAKKAHSQKYFSKQISKLDSPALVSSVMQSTISKFESGHAEQLDQVSGLLHAEMRVIEKNIDSDATASSSGGESADEATQHNNHSSIPMSIAKRAAYKYAKDRGAVAARFCWIHGQMADVNIKIRNYTDIYNHLKQTKDLVTLEEPSVNGFEGVLPGSSSSAKTTESPPNGAYDSTCSAARTKSFKRAEFTKRKLLQTANLHTISKKASRPSTVKCGCQWPMPPCALCTGRTDPTAPRDLPDMMPASERVALLDPGFHPVLSFPEDVAHSVHFEAVMSQSEWQEKVMRCSAKTIMKNALLSNRSDRPAVGPSVSHSDELQNLKLKNGAKKSPPNFDPVTGKRKYTKKYDKYGSGALATKIKQKNKKHHKLLSQKFKLNKRLKPPLGLSKLALANGRGNGINGDILNNFDGSSDLHSGLTSRSKTGSPLPPFNRERLSSASDLRKSRNYDIDNIVIPYSIAASTRVEILPYKEIPTPKWRLVEDLMAADKEPKTSQSKAAETEASPSGEENESEDISDEQILAKHERALIEERRKFESYLKFPLTSRSRANRRIDSRGNESSGANTPDPTSPAPTSVADLESIPPSPAACPSTPLEPLEEEIAENQLIQVINNTFNGKKERRRTTSKQLTISEMNGYAIPRSMSTDLREMIPPYEPIAFPLSDDLLSNLKRAMPKAHLQQVEKYFSTPLTVFEERMQIVKRRPRKHNDSLSESKLIKDKLQSSSPAGINLNNNVLIPLNNHHANVINNAKINSNAAHTTTISDNMALKKLLNNNNHTAALLASPALLNINNVNSLNNVNNLNGLEDEVASLIDDDDDYMRDDNEGTDSETETGEESYYVPDDSEEEDEDIVEEVAPRRPRGRPPTNNSPIAAKKRQQKRQQREDSYL